MPTSKFRTIDDYYVPGTLRKAHTVRKLERLKNNATPEDLAKYEAEDVQTRIWSAFYNALSVTSNSTVWSGTVTATSDTYLNYITTGV